MESCPSCPGPAHCNGVNLVPLLLFSYRQHKRGADKMAILSNLDEALEERVTPFIAKATPTCWSKSAILAIAHVVADIGGSGASGDDLADRVQQGMTDAVAAFARFPWHIEHLNTQFGPLYERIMDLDQWGTLRESLSPRAFRKICAGITDPPRS